MRLLLILLAFTALLACSRTNHYSTDNLADTTAAADSSVLAIDSSAQTEAAGDEDRYMNLQSYITQADESKTQVIDFDCAIMVYPNEAQIKAMEKTMSEEELATVADDYSWYQSQAGQLIDSLHIKTVTAQQTYLTLKGENASWTLNVRKDNLPEWNLIFFKKTKTPQIVSAIDMTLEDVKAYFEVHE